MEVLDPVNWNETQREGRIMKIANRFLIILASILLGGLLGMGYFVAEWYQTAPKELSESARNEALKEYRSDFDKIRIGNTSGSVQKKESQRIAQTPATPRAGRPIRIAPPGAKMPTLHALTTRQKERAREEKEKLARTSMKSRENTIQIATGSKKETGVNGSWAENLAEKPTAPMTLEMANAKMVEMAQESEGLSESLQSLMLMATKSPAKTETRMETLEGAQNTEIADATLKEGQLRDAVIQVAEEKSEKRTALIQVADFHPTQIADRENAGEIQIDVITETSPNSLPEKEVKVENIAQITELPALDGELETVATETAIGNRADINFNPFRKVLIVEVPVREDGTRIETDESEEAPEEAREAEVVAVEGNAENPESVTKAEVVAESSTGEKVEGKTEEAQVASSSEDSSRKYKLDIHRENVRKALSAFQTETGLKVVASLDVQGEVTCQLESEEAEALLRNMLAETAFRFVRDGEWVYVAREEKIRNFKGTLGKTKTELFVPKFIPVEELELILQASMSQFGKLERAQNGVKVTDWTLSLAELRELQKLVDLPPAENRIEAFVFQHELNGASKSPLDLVTVAENRGLVLQRLAIPELDAKKDKKPIFNKKKETVEPIQAYSISYRASTFMIAVKDQLGVTVANMPGERTARIELNQLMSFGFELDVAGEKVPYGTSLRFFENPKAGEEGESPILAELTCMPTGEVDERSKPRPVKCVLPMPMEGNNALVFQLDLGEFANHDPERKKNPIYAWHGNRVLEEVVVAFCPYKEAQERPRTTLTNAAIQAVIHKQEVLGRKFYGSLNAGERENSARYFTLAQRLRQGLEP